MKKVEYHTPDNSNINILLWGKEGVGKTYLTASMPKPCLYLTFDPNALNGINDRIKSGEIKAQDVPLIPFDEGDYKEIANAYKNPRNPFSLNELYEQLKFKTIVIDSLTSFFKLALQFGVEYANSVEKEKSTIERPGFAGYGVRSVATKEMIFNVVNWCNKHKVNSIFIAHEGEMVKDANTGALYHGITLSGDIPAEMARWFDECWYLGIGQEGTRQLAFHPMPSMRPLKTRMFSDDVRTVQADSLNISHLLDAWRVNGKVNDQVLQQTMKG